MFQVYYNLGLERGITLSSLVHCPGMVEEASELLKKLGVDATDMKQLQQVKKLEFFLFMVKSFLLGLQLLPVWNPTPIERSQCEIRSSGEDGGISYSSCSSFDV